MPATAITGGHVTNLSGSNDIIRQIVEARNRSRETAIDTDEDREVQEEIEKSLPMDEPLAGVFDENPKDMVGSTKLPLHLWPTTATAMGSVALLNGALKYGRSNWRKVGVRASIYVDACQRHLAAWFEGSECDEEGVPHLASALACLAILVDCDAAGKLRDDRQVAGGHPELIAKLTSHVARLKELHDGKNPKHYTIADNVA